MVTNWFVRYREAPAPLPRNPHEDYAQEDGDNGADPDDCRFGECELCGDVMPHGCVVHNWKGTGMMVCGGHEDGHTPAQP